MGGVWGYSVSGVGLGRQACVTKNSLVLDSRGIHNSEDMEKKKKKKKRIYLTLHSHPSLLILHYASVQTAVPALSGQSMSRNRPIIYTQSPHLQLLQRARFMTARARRLDPPDRCWPPRARSSSSCACSGSAAGGAGRGPGRRSQQKLRLRLHRRGRRPAPARRLQRNANRGGCGIRRRMESR